MKTLFSSLGILICLTSMFILSATESKVEFSDSYKTIDDPKALIASEFKIAKAENKKLLFVLGGNWCHDSRSLAKKLQDETLSEIIKADYRVSMVDVGYLNQGFEFLEKTNMSTFYATPTVLIFDPQTGQHLNAGDMHIWANASQVSQQDSKAYFEKYSNVSAVKITENISDAQQLHLVKLEKFLETQEGRIKLSYGVVGPLLERYKAGEKDENFEPYWDSLASLRMKLPADILQIREKIIAASDVELDGIIFPDYAALPWE